MHDMIEVHNTIEVEIYQTTVNGIVPQRRTEEAAGYSLAVPSTFTIRPFVFALVNLEIQVKFMKNDYCALVIQRGFENVIRILPTIINSDENGNLNIAIQSTRNYDVKIHRGDIIAELLFLRLPKTEMIWHFHQYPDYEKLKELYDLIPNPCCGTPYRELPLENSPEELTIGKGKASRTAKGDFMSYE